jgi:hypothetical protein
MRERGFVLDRSTSSIEQRTDGVTRRRGVHSCCVDWLTHVFNDRGAPCRVRGQPSSSKPEHGRSGFQQRAHESVSPGMQPGRRIRARNYARQLRSELVENCDLLYFNVRLI